MVARRTVLRMFRQAVPERCYEDLRISVAFLRRGDSLLARMAGVPRSSSESREQMEAHSCGCEAEELPPGLHQPLSHLSTGPCLTGEGKQASQYEHACILLRKGIDFLSQLRHTHQPSQLHQTAQQEPSALRSVSLADRVPCSIRESAKLTPIYPISGELETRRPQLQIS